MNKTGCVTLIGDMVVPSSGVMVDCRLHGRLIGNLEAPVCRDTISKRPKAGPHLISKAVPAVLREGVVSLANNHIMDYGEEGLQETISQCRALNVSTMGAGQTLSEAQRPVIITEGSVRIGLLARCETQFGAATLWRPGVATLDPGIYDDIRRLKQEVDIVIVSVHGSTEMSPWPSPRWQSHLRSMIDAGATVVHGHHPHVPQGYEQYKGGLVFYGFGNFIANPKRWKNIPNTLWSMISRIEFSKSGIKDYHVDTVTIEDEAEVRVRESTGEESAYYKEYLDKACSGLSDSRLLTGLWQEVSMRLYHMWYAQWLGFQSGTVFHKVRKSASELLRNPRKAFLLKQHVRKIFDVKFHNLRRYHLFACESHQDAIAVALGLLSGELEDLRTKETEFLTNQMAPWLRKH